MPRKPNTLFGQASLKGKPTTVDSLSLYWQVGII